MRDLSNGMALTRRPVACSLWLLRLKISLCTSSSALSGAHGHVARTSRSSFDRATKVRLACGRGGPLSAQEFCFQNTMVWRRSMATKLSKGGPERLERYLGGDVNIQHVFSIIEF